MDLIRLLVQAVIALVCAGIATTLIPRRIPGKLPGLVLTGFAGVWLGEQVLAFFRETYRFPIPDFVVWDIQGVSILPAIIGSAIVLYVVTLVCSGGRYQR